MGEQVKICPGCGGEFYPHVDMCDSCEVRLVFPEELGELERQEAAVHEAEGKLVCIEEGAIGRVSELAKVLDEAGIEAHVVKGGGKCAGDGGFGLLVHQSHMEKATEVLEKYWLTIHPELAETKKRMESGLCPACGAKVGGSAAECPDCGLFLGGPDGDTPGRP
ncbi:MAG TPA: hypothetical protein ENJ37_01940 [Deltaproteobacteria bacterium]|nr:hypothetical protein [Deltaproteobacteria bacterium]